MANAAVAVPLGATELSLALPRDARNPAMPLAICTDRRPSPGPASESASPASKSRPGTSRRSNQASRAASAAKKSLAPLKSPLDAMRSSYSTTIRSRIETVRRARAVVNAFSSASSSQRMSGMMPGGLAIPATDDGLGFGAAFPSSAADPQTPDLIHSPGRLRQFFAEVHSGSGTSMSASSTGRLLAAASVPHKYQMMKSLSAAARTRHSSHQPPGAASEPITQFHSSLMTPVDSNSLRRVSMFAGPPARRRSTTAPAAPAVLPPVGGQFATLPLTSRSGAALVRRDDDARTLPRDQSAISEEPAGSAALPMPASLADSIPSHLVTPILNLLIQAAAEHQRQHAAATGSSQEAAEEAAPSIKPAAALQPRRKLGGPPGSVAPVKTDSVPAPTESNPQPAPLAPRKKLPNAAARPADELESALAKSATEPVPSPRKKQAAAVAVAVVAARETEQPAPPTRSPLPKIAKTAQPSGDHEVQRPPKSRPLPKTTPKEPEANPATAPRHDPNAPNACRTCGRQFAEDRLEKHEQICARAATRVRKPFDERAMRSKGTDLEAAPAKPAADSAAAAATGASSDWRTKRNQFINNLRAAKEVQAHIAAGGKASDLPPPPPTIDPSLRACPHCSRRFGENAYARHVSVCENVQHKPNPVKRPPRS